MFGGLIGGALSLGSSLLGKKSAKSQEAGMRLGFDYLKDNDLVKQTQEQGQDATGLRGALLGLGGDTQAAEDAFSTFRDSTGYQFQMDQGMAAIEGSRAAKGILNSGATAKELTKFGQGLGASYFKDFMGMLGQEADAGMSAVQSVGSAGSQAGAGVANARAQGDKDMMSGLTSAITSIGSIWG